MTDKRCERGPLLSFFQILCGAGYANRYTHFRAWREGRMVGRKEGRVEGRVEGRMEGRRERGMEGRRD
jgi:hypothetical protein